VTLPRTVDGFLRRLIALFYDPQRQPGSEHMR
jgi:hypothetical protein